MSNVHIVASGAEIREGWKGIQVKRVLLSSITTGSRTRFCSKLVRAGSVYKVRTGFCNMCACRAVSSVRSWGHERYKMGVVLSWVPGVGTGRT